MVSGAKLIGSNRRLTAMIIRSRRFSFPIPSLVTKPPALSGSSSRDRRPGHPNHNRDLPDSPHLRTGSAFALEGNLTIVAAPESADVTSQQHAVHLHLRLDPLIVPRHVAVATALLQNMPRIHQKPRPGRSEMTFSIAARQSHRAAVCGRGAW